MGTKKPTTLWWAFLVIKISLVSVPDILPDLDHYLYRLCSQSTVSDTVAACLRHTIENSKSLKAKPWPPIRVYTQL